jgi:microcystin degradation protein MlrC
MRGESLKKVVVMQCQQEISSFNPMQSGFENFHIARGGAILLHRGLNTEIGGALSVLEARDDITVVPTIAATSDSAGPLGPEGWRQLSDLLLSEVLPALQDAEAVYVSLHGAMAATSEMDPEGFLLGEIRRVAGPDKPIVVSLDLHGILTERMLHQVNGVTVYHTYPHVDFAETGVRAARLLLDILDGKVRPVLARVVIPALVRGDELITRSGVYGELIRDCQRLERDGTALAAGILIGNPFTDVPELCSQVIVQTDADPDRARAEAERLAAAFWQDRRRMQGKLIPLDQAIATARTLAGPVIFTDAADATSSGASGDSNAILRALRDARYDRPVLAQIVDPQAAAAAHAAGVGAEIEVTLGGACDPRRFTPMPVRAHVRLLGDGSARLETMKTPLFAGPTAVLEFANFTVVTMSRAVSLFDRAMYFANGCNPRDYDLIVVKSPHTEAHMFDAWAERNFNIDAPGATSANIRSLGHSNCARPMFPLDQDLDWSPTSVLFDFGS